MPKPIALNEAVEVEFKRLMNQDAQHLLRPEAIVAAARDPQHILHHCFTWDDEAAADSWRIEEARMLIRSYRIDIPELKIKVRALTSLEVDRANGGFRWVRDVLERPDLREEMIRTAWIELDRIRRKYVNLEELNDIWALVDQKRPGHTFNN
jgi:hypothetical protein